MLVADRLGVLVDTRTGPDRALLGTRTVSSWDVQLRGLARRSSARPGAPKKTTLLTFWSCSPSSRSRSPVVQLGRSVEAQTTPAIRGDARS
jgi:hypothetical protein